MQMDPRVYNADLAESCKYGTSFGAEEKEFVGRNICIDPDATIKRREFVTSGMLKPSRLAAMRSRGLNAMVREKWTDANVQRDPPFGFDREAKTQTGAMLYLTLVQSRECLHTARVGTAVVDVCAQMCCSALEHPPARLPVT